MSKYSVTISNIANGGSHLYLTDENNNLLIYTHTAERLPEMKDKVIPEMQIVFSALIKFPVADRKVPFSQIMEGYCCGMSSSEQPNSDKNKSESKPEDKNNENVDEKNNEKQDGMRFIKMYASELLSVEEYKKLKVSQISNETKLFIRDLIDQIREGKTKIYFKGDREKEIIDEICSEYSIYVEFGKEADKEEDKTFAILTYN